MPSDMILNLATFGRRTLRDISAQRQLCQTVEIMMHIFRFCLLFLPFALPAYAEVSPKAEVTWSGIYSVAETVSMDESKSLSGKVLQSVGPVDIKATSRIPATIGTRFGFGFVIKDSDVKDLTVRYVWRFPGDGLTNASSGQSARHFEIVRKCHVGNPCANAWAFNHDWELKPGTWTAEVWLGETMLASRSFEIYRP